MRYNFALLVIMSFPIYGMAQIDSLRDEKALENGKKKALVFIAKKKKVGTLSFHFFFKNDRNQLQVTLEQHGREKISAATDNPTTLKFENNTEYKLYPVQNASSFAVPLFIAGATVKVYYLEQLFMLNAAEIKLLSEMVIKVIEMGTTDGVIVMEVPRKNALRAKSMASKVFR